MYKHQKQIKILTDGEMSWLVYQPPMNDIFEAMLMTNNIFTQTETALMYDAVQIFARALSELDQSQVNTTAKI